MAASRRQVARTVVLGSLLAVPGSSSEARAQAGDVATAEMLFRQGKQVLDAKDYAQACPRLAESYRLDPTTGALFALAACHEGHGMLASAWNEDGEALARAQREGRADRVSAAKEHIQAIEPRLSSLTIKVSDSVAALPGFELKRDGVVLGKVVVGMAVPVDGGDHAVEVSAAGKRPWKMIVAVGRENDKKTVNLSSLDDAASVAAPVVTPAPAIPGVAVPPNAATPQPPAIATPQPTPAVAPASTVVDSTASPVSRGLSSTQIAGIATAGAGAVGLAVGSIFGLSAISKNNDAKTGCTDTVCKTSEAFQSRNDARSAAAVSTIAFVVGGVLAATGVTLYAVGDPKGEQKTGLSVVPSVGAGQWDLSLQGAF
jgi:hypothetical protein